MHAKDFHIIYEYALQLPRITKQIILYKSLNMLVHTRKLYQT